MSPCQTSKTFCIIPWIHMHIVPTGRVFHCCQMTDYSDPLGQLDEQSLAELWNGEKLRKIRRQMLVGEEPSACSTCLRDEAARAGEGTRTRWNREFAHRLPAVAGDTAPDGRVETMTLAYWDFRFSNLCQLKCRTCGPDYSSAWIPEARKFGAEFWWNYSDSTPKVLEIKQVSGRENIEFLRKHLDQVEHVYFAGGEPLLMDEHWEILDMLEASGRTDVLLSYNSNFGKLEYQGRNVLDYWTRWQGEVRVAPSIDEVGERAELVRSGTHWKSMEANLLAARRAGIDLRPNITVSVFNVSRLPEIIEYLIGLDVIRIKDDRTFSFSFNIVYWPAHYRVGVLPAAQRSAIVDRLSTYIDECAARHGANVRDQFQPVTVALETAASPSDVVSFLKMTRLLDESRNENTASVLPELAEILK